MDEKDKKKIRLVCWCGLELAPDPKWPYGYKQRSDLRYKCPKCEAIYIYEPEEVPYHNTVVTDSGERAIWQEKCRQIRHVGKKKVSAENDFDLLNKQLGSKKQR